MKKSKSDIAYEAVSLTLTIALMSLIFYLSAQNATDSTHTSSFVSELIYKITGILFPQSTIRTLAHFSEYTVLGFSVSNTFFAFKNKALRLLPAAASWLYAWSDEIHQIFVDGRAFQLFDLSVDLGGIILGTFVFYFLMCIIKKITEKKKTH